MSPRPGCETEPVVGRTIVMRTFLPAWYRGAVVGAICFAGINLSTGPGARAAEGEEGDAKSSLQRELLEAEVVISELELALEAAHLRCTELEELLGRQQERDVPLEVALAAANAEAEAYRERYRDLRLNVESWGLETLRSDEALRERLITAVREREQAMKRHGQALEQLMSLSEAVMEYLKTSSSSDADVRLRVEEELRKTDDVLGFGARRVSEEDVAKQMDEGRVVSFKPEFRLAVLDIGRRSGVRLGLPMELYRKDRRVGSGIVVDVRERICRLVIQQVYKEGDSIRVQDRAEPRMSKTVEF